MKFIEEIGADKLRGAFYTPPALVDACLRRLSSLLDTRQWLRILEPSSGDGAFVRGLHSAKHTGSIPYPDVTCIEVLESEARKCQEELKRCGLAGQVLPCSFFEWANNTNQVFDAVVGNPPFVRYQFVPEQDRMLAEVMLRSEGQDLQGVSNLWIPFVLLSLRCLRVGGAFALVLPSELLSTLSSGQIRSALVRDFETLRIELFPRDSFPDILQDVIVVGGVRAECPAVSRSVTFSEHSDGTIREWCYRLPASDAAWTHYLLTSEQSEAIGLAKCLPNIHRLGDVATIGVAIVTGANDFFTVENSIVQEYELQNWVRPLLARTAESQGIVFTQEDFEKARRQEKKSWLLDFSQTHPDPMCHDGAKRYLQRGEEQGLPLRYKCRIRSPWYCVPHIKRGALMMAKRSHQHHRLILNQAEVFTTDTIYRGEMKPRFAQREASLVSGFHNSLTLLSAELEGRTYGGGVLELVPSEIARLTVPMAETQGFFEQLDQVSRAAGGQQDKEDLLIAATDEILCRLIPPYQELLPSLAMARQRLRERRFHG